ncbi:protein jagunal-like [Centruroides vittatus]|uniref:protein jagunal-like n=1 Tax=Centruroides vittatus TaxID=120091 RepID=UPI003510930F
MASREGKWVSGTDGNDYRHRQKIASQYYESSLYKSRLRMSIFLHFLLFLLMALKLSENILNQFAITIQELKNMNIPKPHLWEWIWTVSLVFAFIGLSGARRNRSSLMQIYVTGTFLFGLFPIFWAAVYFLEDVINIALNRNSTEIDKWFGYPVAVVWYIFITIAFQVHIFSMYFAIKLIKVWDIKSTKKT